jgi:hypothetical protein
MVQTAVALRPGSGHQLCGECTERNHDIAFSGCGRDNAHVLVMQVDPETRFEIASKHASRLAFEDSASSGAAGEHRDGSLGVYPVRAQETMASATSSMFPATDQLVRGLHGLAGTRRTNQHHGGAYSVEDRLYRIKVRAIGSDHDGKSALDGSRFTASPARP